MNIIVLYFVYIADYKTFISNEIPTKSNKKKNNSRQQLPCIKKVIDKCSYASSSTSNISMNWEPILDVLDCKTLIPPNIHPSTLKPPTPNIKMCVDQTCNVRRKMTPSKHNKLNVTRRYHKKLPELVRNDTFFTIQGYSLPPSMAHITRFVPGTPKGHKHLAIIRRPLFEDESNIPFPSHLVVPPFKTIFRSKSRLNSDYISRAWDRVTKIEKFCKNWPWKNESSITKGLLIKSKGNLNNMLLVPPSSNNVFLKRLNANNSLEVVQSHSLGLSKDIVKLPRWSNNL